MAPGNVPADAVNLGQLVEIAEGSAIAGGGGWSPLHECCDAQCNIWRSAMPKNVNNWVAREGVRERKVGRCREARKEQDQT